MKWLDIFVLVLMAISGVAILVYGLLKAFGVINTPVWILAIPYIAGGVTVLTVVYYFGKASNRIELMNKRLGSYSRMRDDFLEVRNNQKLCLSGQLNKSPYGKG